NQGMVMNLEIEKSNYLEWVKLVQRAYTVGYISSLIILSHILTLNSATDKDTLNISLLSVSFPRIPAVLFTLFIFIVAGAFVIYAYAKLEKLCNVIDENSLSSLKNFPSFAHIPVKGDCFLVGGLLIIYFMVFKFGQGDGTWINAIINSILVCSTFIIASVYKAYDKPLEKSSESKRNI
ncbi:hypothetical protein J8L84_20230, partial [Alteromonas sp. MMG017]|uniref:hypothetical protein n=1 Tax=Alteromonas sp. MMG017 TaxID=2822692 RepID=UPI001B3A1679